HLRKDRLNIVIFGLSITSSGDNGQATTYRGLVYELVQRGHDVLFLEKEKPRQIDNRDLHELRYGRLEFYSSLEDVMERFEDEVRRADMTIVGSYVNQGMEIGRWVNRKSKGITAFYDFDPP